MQFPSLLLPLWVALTENLSYPSVTLIGCFCGLLRRWGGMPDFWECGQWSHLGVHWNNSTAPLEGCGPQGLWGCSHLLSPRDRRWGWQDWSVWSCCSTYSPTAKQIILIKSGIIWWGRASWRLQGGQAAEPGWSKLSRAGLDHPFIYFSCIIHVLAVSCMDGSKLILKSWVDAELSVWCQQSCLQSFQAVISDPSNNLEPLSVTFVHVTAMSGRGRAHVSEMTRETSPVS